MPSLKALQDDNAKLKKLLAEAEPDKAMLKEIAAKPVLSSADEPVTRATLARLGKSYPHH